ncbi:TPA: SAVED domain-containing protein [Clostridioides difficile]|nr:SAVED domain-containing protein [Clostridioides difficile]
MIIVLCFLIIVIIIGIIFTVLKFKKSKKEEGVASLLFTTGITLITSSTPATIDKCLDLLCNMTKLNNTVSSTDGFNYPYFVVGVILVGISIFQYIHIKKKIYILNINGYMHKKIEDFFGNLKIDNFEFKEREIDFVKIYKKLFCYKLNEEAFMCIKEDIEDKVKAFKEETKNNIKRGYTGIAPIPFIMYAGTFLQRENIDEYYELDKISSETYYKLTTHKGVDFQEIKLKTDINSLNKSNTELVVTISLTQKITDSDLSQFSNIDKIHIGIDDLKDNAIRSKEILNEYKNFIFDNIEKLLKEFPYLKTIHLVYAGQSCLALEMGKRSFDSTRLPEIIIYQYEGQSNKKYPWGIIINGQKKGDLVKAE